MAGDSLSHASGNGQYEISRTSVLVNEDLLSRIFEEFPFEPFDEQTNNNTRKHLLWAALSCRSFCDPALDVLWKSINTFLPLFKLLPAFKLVQGEYVIRGTISDADWDRFNYYASKVREFIYPGFQDDNIVGAHAKVRLAQIWRAPLLPKLQRYTCYDVRSLGPFIHSLFISPLTEYVNLGLITETQDSSVGTLLSILVNEVPQLKTLLMNGTLSFNSLAYVVQFKNLQRLELETMGESIDSQLLEQISELEHLVDLKIDLYNSPSSTFSIGNGFKSLRKLQITASLTDIEQILLDLSDQVELESLGFVTPPTPLPLSWESQFTSLCNTVLSRWPTSLRRFTVDREWANLLCLSLSIAIIAPLLQLPNVEHFAVHAFFFPLTDEGIVQLATAWPALQELHIPLDDNLAPEISFSILYKLAELCPRLRLLEIPLDTSDVPPLTVKSHDHSSPRPQLTELRDLLIANDNTPTEPQQLLLIARHFDRLFPRLQKLGRSKVKDPESTTWDKIYAMILAFRDVRLESSL